MWLIKFIFRHGTAADWTDDNNAVGDWIWYAITHPTKCLTNPVICSNLNLFYVFIFFRHVGMGRIMWKGGYIHLFRHCTRTHSSKKLAISTQMLLQDSALMKVKLFFAASTNSSHSLIFPFLFLFISTPSKGTCFPHVTLLGWARTMLRCVSVTVLARCIAHAY